MHSHSIIASRSTRLTRPADRELNRSYSWRKATPLARRGGRSGAAGHYRPVGFLMGDTMGYPQWMVYSWKKNHGKTNYKWMENPTINGWFALLMFISWKMHGWFESSPILGTLHIPKLTLKSSETPWMQHLSCGWIEWDWIRSDRCPGNRIQLSIWPLSTNLLEFYSVFFAHSDIFWNPKKWTNCRPDRSCDRSSSKFMALYFGSQTTGWPREI